MSQGCDSLFALLVRHITMGDEAHVIVCEASIAADFMVLEQLARQSSVVTLQAFENLGRHSESKNVSFDELGFDLDIRDRGKLLRQEGSVPMIFLDMVFPVFECDESAGSKDAGLSHRPSE